VVKRLLHEPTLRMKELRDDRVHARMALVRDLFGLGAEDVRADAAQPAESAEPLAEVRALSERRR
jgi:glutamyl-tRNA reductase